MLNNVYDLNKGIMPCLQFRKGFITYCNFFKKRKRKKKQRNGYRADAIQVK